MFNINYLGADQSSFTLNFSKGASQVIGQYCQYWNSGYLTLIGTKTPYLWPVPQTHCQAVDSKQALPMLWPGPLYIRTNPLPF